MPLPVAEDDGGLGTLAAAAAASVAAPGGGDAALRLLAAPAPCEGVAAVLSSRGEVSRGGGAAWACVEGEVVGRRRLEGEVVLLGLEDRDAAARGAARADAESRAGVPRPPSDGPPRPSPLGPVPRPSSLGPSRGPPSAPAASPRLLGPHSLPP